MSHANADRLPPAAALVRLSFLVQSVYARVAEEHELTPQQAQLLCVLMDGARGITELTRMLRLEKSSVSGLVDRAEQRGLVGRAGSPQDRRAVVVALTAAGRRIAHTFFDRATDELVALLEPLGEQDRADFACLATRLVLSQEVPPVFGRATRATSGGSPD